MTNRSPLDTFLQLRALVTGIERRVDGRLVYGSSVGDVVLMRSVRDAGDEGIRRQDLAELVQLSPSGVTRALQPLEKRGYVETLEQETDARVRRVRLTATGERLYGEILADLEQRVSLFADELSAADLHASR